MNAFGEVKISQSSPELTALIPSRLRVLCEVDRPKVEASHNGWDAVLDGTRGR